MKTLNQSNGLDPLISPTTSTTKHRRRSIKHILIAAGLLAAGLGVSAGAAQNTNQAVDPEAEAHANWHALMKQTPVNDQGCFHASYPSTGWEKVDCEIQAPRTPTHVKRPELEIVGNGNDYVGVATGLITSAA